MLLVGDVGGTKTALALVTPQAGPHIPLAHATYHSSDYPSLAALVRPFLAQAVPSGERIDAACFDVPGPVFDGRARLTNLPWTLDEAALQDELGLTTVHLLNDLQATAYAVPLLEQRDMHTLNAGTPAPSGSIAVLAPGTGLGEALLLWDGARYRAYPSEGGHADFAPVTPLQIGLLQDMLERYDHVSYEHVCAGIGIPHLYDYLRRRGAAPESPALAQAMAAVADPTPLIVAAAVRPAAPDQLSVAALELFVAILGAEASNLVLKVLATGGLYLAGGLPTRLLPLLDRAHFMAAFRNKGRFADLLSRVPVHVIVEQAALIGAASYGLMLAGTGPAGVHARGPLELGAGT
jgi:glucokinase